MWRWFTLYNVYVISDEKTQTYISEAYKINKKNKLAIEKEVEKLNLKNPWRYKLSNAFVWYQWETTFNRLKY